jgi:hypothetical protein
VRLVLGRGGDAAVRRQVGVEGADLRGSVVAGCCLPWKWMKRRIQKTYASSVRAPYCSSRAAARTRQRSFGEYMRLARWGVARQDLGGAESLHDHDAGWSCTGPGA